MNKRLMIILFSIVCISICLVANAEDIKHDGNDTVFIYDFSTIDWTMTKQDYIKLLQDITYTEWVYNNAESMIEIDSYLFGNKANCSLYFNVDGSLDFICACVYDFNDKLFSPTYTIALLSSNLGIPDFIDDPYGEDTGFSYYTWHRSVWLSNPSAIFVYSSNDELYYQLTEDGTDNSVYFDIMDYWPQILIYRWDDYEAVKEEYYIDKHL